MRHRCLLLFLCSRTSAFGLLSKHPLAVLGGHIHTNLEASLDLAETSMLKPLSPEVVKLAIGEAVLEDNELAKTLREANHLFLEVVESWQDTFQAVKVDADASHYEATKTPWHFGINIKNTETNEIVGIVTFYVAYSSWNGRILYAEYIKCQGLDEELKQVLLRMLAQIGLELDCARLTWRHTTTPEWHSKGSNKPEMHDEVLTLSMDKKAMSTFTSDSPLKSVISTQAEFKKDVVESAFSDCLDRVNSQPEAKFQLRLAKRADLETMTSLVQGLADYVKESDAVHMTSRDYVQDGFDLDDPLWYCILVDKLDVKGQTHTCGYAFVFVGYELGQGRFMYLEDLYLEVEQRGIGGGKLVMKTLAGLCTAMQCTHLYWQALDWNSSALNFYKNIGARIHIGEKTSRYATDALKLFAENGSN